MATVKTIIDLALQRVGDEGLDDHTRAEVLLWIDEAYRKAASQAEHARTFTAMSLPPRHVWANTYDHEARLSAPAAASDITSGPYRKFTFTHESGKRECTYLWEAQSSVGETTTPGTRSVTQLWELSSGEGESVQTYRFSLNPTNSRVLRVWQNDRPVLSTTRNQLDNLFDDWWATVGLIRFYASSPDYAQYDLYEISTEYRQPYDNIGTKGLPTSFSGDRTYEIDSDTDSWGYSYAWSGEPQAHQNALPGIGRKFTFGPEDNYHYTYSWEGQAHRGETVTAATESSAVTSSFEQPANLEVGIPRFIVSPDRQYFPSPQWEVQGIPRAYASSDDNLLVYHQVLPTELVVESDELLMIPDQLHKYLVYFAVAMMMNRQGESYDPALSGHYFQRADRIIQLLSRYRMATRLNVRYERGRTRTRRDLAPNLPGMPSNFPLAPWVRR